MYQCVNEVYEGGRSTFQEALHVISRPHLESSLVICTSYLKKSINTLEDVQHHAAKLLDGCKNLNFKERVTSLDLPSLTYR